MTNSERLRGLDSIICDELNIQELVHSFKLITDSGPIELVYNRKDDRHYVQLSGNEVYSPKTLELLINHLTSYD